MNTRGGIRTGSLIIAVALAAVFTPLPQYGSNAAFDYQRKEDAGLIDRVKNSPEVFGEVELTSLPPDLGTRQDEDRQKYLDIGEPDRFTLKFRKPAAAK